MYQEFNDLYLKYKKFLPQKLAFKMAYKAIQATDGARTQEKRLNCTESEARKRMQEYFENDYLGLDYFLYDANDNEIMRLEQ